MYYWISNSACPRMDCVRLKEALSRASHNPEGWFLTLMHLLHSLYPMVRGQWLPLWLLSCFPSNSHRHGLGSNPTCFCLLVLMTLPDFSLALESVVWSEMIFPHCRCDEAIFFIFQNASVGLLYLWDKIQALLHDSTAKIIFQSQITQKL